MCYVVGLYSYNDVNNKKYDFHSRVYDTQQLRGERCHMRIGNEDLFINYTVKDWNGHENKQIDGQSLEYYSNILGW